jgi:hypothetical protein
VVIIPIIVMPGGMGTVELHPGPALVHPDGTRGEVLVEVAVVSLACGVGLVVPWRKLEAIRSPVAVMLPAALRSVIAR